MQKKYSKSIFYSCYSCCCLEKQKTMTTDRFLQQTSSTNVANFYAMRAKVAKNPTGVGMSQSGGAS